VSAGWDFDGARQRSGVAMLTPTSRDTSSTAALSGGSSGAAMRSLNDLAHRATLVHLRPSFRRPERATTELTQGGAPRKRGLASGVMTAFGGLGHALP
jgi:hypothetical protein